MTRGCRPLLLDQTAIDPAGREEQVEDRQGGRRTLVYQRLVVATGAEPIRPDIGLDLPGVYVLHTMDEIFVHEALAAEGVRVAA